jgi:hypothetical protein
MLFRRRRCAKPCASAVKHPVKSDFHTIVTKAGMSLTFKPTDSVYIFDRRGDNYASFVGVQHAGHNTADYPYDEVQDVAHQIASEYPAVHFGQFPDEDEARRTAVIIAKLT